MLTIALSLSSGGVAMRYSFPVLLMQSCLHISGQEYAAREKRILKMTHQGQHEFDAAATETDPAGAA